MSGENCGQSGTDCPPGFLQGSSNGVPSPYSYYNPPPSSYVVNSKIMVVAVAVLFAVVVFILCLHVYAKWFWRSQGAAVSTDGAQMLSWRRRRHRVQNPSPGQVILQSVGLAKAVIEALPTFEFDGEAMKRGLECAVCLEEFEEGEKGRTLPKCAHSFHLECVDMWLHSHSTCPLCRASVRTDEDAKEATVVAIGEPEAQTEAAVMGDVQAPFMAAMRASRRRQRSRGRSMNSPTRRSSLARSDEEQQEGQNPRHSDSTESSNSAGELQESQKTPTSVDPKALWEEYETLPSNVLFWGNNAHQAQMSSAEAQPVAESRRGASSVRAPFQVTIDIPRSGAGAATLNPANVMSPMARASASFRRLLSRGKSLVSPQDDMDEDDRGSSSYSSSHSPRPRPSNGS